MSEKPVRVSILVFPECAPSIIYGIFDMLWSAGRLWDSMTATGATAEPVFEPKIVGAECGPLKLVTGVSTLPQATIAETDADVRAAIERAIAAIDRRGALAAQGSSLLLLDEPTSALDPLAEARVFDRIVAAFPSACIVASVHRPSLLARFDTVVVVEAGRVVEAGPRDEVLARRGH